MSFLKSDEQMAFAHQAPCCPECGMMFATPERKTARPDESVPVTCGCGWSGLAVFWIRQRISAMIGR